MDKYQKLTNLKKNCRFYQTEAKIRDITMVKTNPLLLETIQCPIINPQRRFFGPEARKTQKMTKIFKKPEKN